MVSIFTDIPDPFYERMEFSKYKNGYGDLVDDVDDLVTYGSRFSSVMASSICLVTIPRLQTPCIVNSITNNTKYAIAKRGSINEFWGTIHIMG